MQITSRPHVRTALAALIPVRAIAVAALFAALLILPVAAHAAGSLGVATWEAGTCTGS